MHPPLLLLLTLISCASLTASPPPNIINVFIDDMGWGDLSCFGNQDAHTPHIDRLAAEGLRFEQFYVTSSICSPSRCALTTGQYPQRWRWKLLCDFDGSRPELYHLPNDPGETTNLAATNPDLVTRLTAALLAWHHAMPPGQGPALTDPPKPRKRNNP